MASADRSVVGWLGFTVAIAALCLALFGLRDSGNGDRAGAADAGTTVTVTLTDFAITPEMIEIPANGATLSIVNAGPSVHNLSIPSLGVLSTDIAAGATSTIKVGAAATGTYDVLCQIPGHADSGMTAMLMVGGATEPGGPPTTMSNAARWTQMMEAVAAQFPAEDRGPRRRPARADGARPTARRSSTSRPRSSTGRSRPARSSRPGPTTASCPAPTIHVEVGDKVRIVLTNELPRVDRRSTSTACGCRTRWTASTRTRSRRSSPARAFTYEFDAHRAGRRHVPLPPQRPGAGARTACSAPS